jgi:hypothetical protein
LEPPSRRDEPRSRSAGRREPGWVARNIELAPGYALDPAQLQGIEQRIEELHQSGELAHAALQLGIVNATNGDEQAARTCYLFAAASAHPEHGPAPWYHLGLLHAGLGDTDGATTAYEHAIESGHPGWGPRAAEGLMALPRA